MVHTSRRWLHGACELLPHPCLVPQGMGLEALREDDDVYGAEDGYGDAGDWGHEGSEGEGEAGSGDR